LDYLQSLKAISKQQASEYLATVISIGQAALRDGYDTTHGGVFESGNPQEGATVTLKVWWVQAESMLAMWKIYQHTQNLADLHMLAETARFVRRFILDQVHGGLYWQVDADGTFVPTNDLTKGTKGNRWKASYHSGRAFVYLHDWISAHL
jgi:mannose/cellobiose epimerase-like protein (N-acyl-D-glucosamine 2-epimerase family)